MTTATTDTAADYGTDLTRDEYVAQVIAKAPPLTAAQIAKLSTLFDQG